MLGLGNKLLIGFGGWGPRPEDGNLSVVAITSATNQEVLSLLGGGGVQSLSHV